MFADLFQLQTEVHNWRTRNFPNQPASVAQAKLTEETGELAAHVHANATGTKKYDHDKAADAVGDTIISALAVADALGIDAAAAVRDAWTEVRTRDWVKYPKNGRTE